MLRAVDYRKGTLQDLASLSFEHGLATSAASLEFNVLGMGHEFWIAIHHERIIAVAVLSQEGLGKLRVLHLEVAPSLLKRGVGTALLKAVMAGHSQYELLVIPSGETEEFYSQLGFVQSGRWEMKWSSGS